MRALDTRAAANQQVTWRVAHETLSRLARERAAADAEEGRWLLAAQRAAVHVHLGFGCFSEYIGRPVWLLAGKEPGAVPGSPANPALQRHVLRFDVAAETFALFGDALNELR